MPVRSIATGNGPAFANHCLCLEALGIPQADLDKVCREINTRSRACLNGCMVADMFDEHIDYLVIINTTCTRHNSNENLRCRRERPKLPAMGRICTSPVFRGSWVDRVIFVESDRVAVEMTKLRPYLVLINAKSPWVYRWGRSSSGWWC